MDREKFIKALYRLALGREADAVGLSGWLELIERTSDPTSVLEGILASEEYQKRQLTKSDPALTAQIISALGNYEYLIVDVGAQILEYEKHIYAPITESGLKHRIIGFEPLADRLNERIKREGQGRLTMLPNAIGDGAAATLYINDFDATSSLYPLNRKLCADFAGLSLLRTVDTLRVETVTLDAALEPEGAEFVDFLKLDIQGAELKALQSAEKTLERTAVVHCEVEFSPIYDGQPLFPEIQRFLNARGFELIDLIIQHRYSYEVRSGAASPDRLLWADAVFFMQDLRAIGKLSQAVTASLIYNKTTLAEYLLAKTTRPCGRI
jgi:FkbM family methyltransferase